MRPELISLKNALSAHNGGKDEALTEVVNAALKSALRSVLPGRQQKGNLEPVMQTARKAFVRTLNRRALS